MHPGRKDPTRLFTYSPENWLPLTRSWPRPLKGGHVKRSLLKSQTAFLVFAPRQSGLLCTDSEFPRKVSVLCLPTTHSPPSFPVSVQSLCSWCSLCAPVANSCGRHNCLRPEVGQGRRESAWIVHRTGSSLEENMVSLCYQRRKGNAVAGTTRKTGTGNTSARIDSTAQNTPYRTSSLGAPPPPPRLECFPCWRGTAPLSPPLPRLL